MTRKLAHAPAHAQRRAGADFFLDAHVRIALMHTHYSQRINLDRAVE